MKWSSDATIVAVNDRPATGAAGEYVTDSTAGDAWSFAPPVTSTLDDAALLSAQRSVAEMRRRVDATAAALAAEIEHRSRRELGHTGLAQRLGARTPERLVQHLTGSTSREASTMVRVGGMMAASPARGADASKARPLPAPVAELAPDARIQGAGAFRFLGMSIYDGFYWSAVRGYSIAAPFALDLVYPRDLDGARLAERSAENSGVLQVQSDATAGDIAFWILQPIFTDRQHQERRVACR